MYHHCSLFYVFFSSRSRHTRCALVTGVQTCARPIYPRGPYRPRPWTLFLPAMLVAAREGPRLTVIQRIFLDAQTASYSMKLMLGRPARGAWQGGGAGQGSEGRRVGEVRVSTWRSLGERDL